MNETKIMHRIDTLEARINDRFDRLVDKVESRLIANGEQNERITKNETLISQNVKRLDNAVQPVSKKTVIGVPAGITGAILGIYEILKKVIP